MRNNTTLFRLAADNAPDWSESKKASAYQPKVGERVRHERGYMGTVRALWHTTADVLWDGRADVLPCDFARLAPEFAPVVEQPKPKAKRDPKAPKALRVKRELRVRREPKAKPTGRIGNRTPPDKEALILAEYDRLKNQREVARLTGTARGTVADVLRRYGVTKWVRPEVVPPDRFCEHCGKQMKLRFYSARPEKLTDFLQRKYCDLKCTVAANRIMAQAEIDKMLSLRRDGRTFMDIASSLNVSKSYVHAICKREMEAARQ
jgi:hypothetical protein